MFPFSERASDSFRDGHPTHPDSVADEGPPHAQVAARKADSEQQNSGPGALARRLLPLSRTLDRYPDIYVIRTSDRHRGSCFTANWRYKTFHSDIVRFVLNRSENGALRPIES